MDNILNARIKLKYDTYANWTRSIDGTPFWATFTPLRGEVCIFDIPATTTATGMIPPAIGIKVGNGTSTLQALPWIQAAAGDVYSWAKKEHGDGADIYATRKDTEDPNDQTKWTTPTVQAWLQSLTNDINGLSGGGGSISTQIEQRIAALTANDIPDLPASKITSSILPVERGGTGVGTLTSGQVLIGNGTNPITTKAIDTTVTSGSNNLITSGAVSTALAGLTGAMHFKGSVQTLPTATDSTTFAAYEAGDVVLGPNNKEYVYNKGNDAASSSWIELGSESSFALNTISITGTNGLTGGGTLTENRTISHATPEGANAGTLGTTGGRQYIQTLTTDEFGHVTSATYASETVTNTTYTFAEGSTNGAFNVTPSGGSVQSVPIHGLKTIATSGSIYDVNEINTSASTASSGQKFFVLDCGDASHFIDNASTT